MAGSGSAERDTLVSRLLYRSMFMWRLTGLAVLLTTLSSPPAAAATPDLAALTARIEQIVRTSPGDVGVALAHIESGARLSIHGDQRFPMASVYKLPIAIEALAQVAEGKLELSRPVTLGPNDIRACCTLSRRYPRGGVTLTLRDLIELMMIESDNSAVDAVLKLVGGPAVVERRLRAQGFKDININRYDAQISLEMCGVREVVAESDWTLQLQRRLIAGVTPEDLRAARARYTTSDPRDTSTPDDMAALLVRLQRGDLLPWPYGEQLIDRMSHAKTGLRRLKARLPPDTVVAHKTGTTDVVINDVGIITLPEGGGHLVLAVFVKNGGRGTMQHTIAEIAAASYESFTGKRLSPPPPPKAIRASRQALARQHKPAK